MIVDSLGRLNGLNKFFSRLRYELELAGRQNDFLPDTALEHASGSVAENPQLVG